MAEDKKINKKLLNWYSKMVPMTNESLKRMVDKAALSPEKLTLTGIISNHSRLWANYAFVEIDIKKSKQLAYTAGLCADRIEDKGNIMTSFITPAVPMILMSDNENLLEKFKNWEYNLGGKNDSWGRVGGLVSAIHLILNNDFDIAKREIEYAVNNFSAVEETKRIGNCLVKIIEGDKSNIKSSIEILCNTGIKERVREMPMKNELYYDWGMVLTKLAWLKGYEVNIDSKFINMELMPNDPLEDYDIPYFFLDGYKGKIPVKYEKFKKKSPNEVQNKDDWWEQYADSLKQKHSKKKFNWPFRKKLFK